MAGTPNSALYLADPKSRFCITCLSCSPTKAVEGSRIARDKKISGELGTGARFDERRWSESASASGRLEESGMLLIKRNARMRRLSPVCGEAYCVQAEEGDSVAENSLARCEEGET